MKKTIDIYQKSLYNKTIGFKVYSMIRYQL